MNIIFKTLRPIWRLIVRISIERKRNLLFFHTIVFNFKYLPFKHAKYLPIFLHSKPIIDKEKLGTIELDIPTTTLRPGMIRLGIDFDKFCIPSNRIRIQLGGMIKFCGPSLIGVNTVIGAAKTGSRLVFGKFTTIGSNCCIRAYKSIEIGSYTRIANNSKVFDTDFHPFRNVKTGIVSQYMKEVIIGRGCFIAAGVYISKGVVIPDYSLVAAHSLLNKNYQTDIVAPFIVGAPAQIKGSGAVRLSEKDAEIISSVHFSKSDEEMSFHTGTPTDYSGTEGSFL